MNAKKRCFVIQGFGTKTDFRTGRALNLDDSYAIIKEAVEAAGLECVRADEIMHSGSIDVEMWEEVFEADLVIADISTSNWNAAYELGVRHALRPATTIVVAEKQFEFAFDINHIAISTYEHLGPELGRSEANRFRDHLQALITEVMSREEEKHDSPVFLSLPGLTAPVRNGEIGEAAPARAAPSAAAADVEEEAAVPETWGKLVERALAAKAEKNWSGAKALLQMAHDIVPREDFITQQLALVTYKGGEPTQEAAFLEARAVLEPLIPDHSNDTETIGMWGAIHKGLWLETGNREHLDRAIRSYGRGFFLKNDTYNAINYGFMLNVRAAQSEPADAIADFVWAQRVRRAVVQIAEAELAHPANPEDHYWLRATLWEAHAGLGDVDAAAHWEQEAREVKLETSDGPQAPEGWMIDSTETQVGRILDLIAVSPLDLLTAPAGGGGAGGAGGGEADEPDKPDKPAKKAKAEKSGKKAKAKKNKKGKKTK